MKRAEEARWVDRARQGDREAFAQLVRRYQRMVYNLAFEKDAEFRFLAIRAVYRYCPIEKKESAKTGENSMFSPVFFKIYKMLEL